MQTVTDVQGGSQHRGERRSLDPCAVDELAPVAHDEVAAGTAADVMAAVGTLASAVALVGR